MQKTPWNPSKRAILKVKNPLPPPTICNYCGSSVKISHHKEIYNGKSFGNWPWAYLCNCCGAYVGMHPFTNIPLGTLADAETRNARKQCKPYFERLWKFNGAIFSRNDAYNWLANKLGIKTSECHFGWFDIDTCHRAKEICENMIIKRGNYHD
ncbi:zinc-finger-containing protein [Photorhabdus bodei]|uniref:zinc-finger-containing protein n=1 Tax=Photorhabdus bodei TaxID=2029681 RepID=UPI0032B7A3EB